MSADETTCRTAGALLSRRTTAWPYRYELLDGLRGVAALAVVVEHLNFISIGHWAVMVFFVISGYCITASAETCRERGLQFMAFLWRRVRRIYPPYLFALVLFTISRAAKAYLGVDNVPARSAIDWVQNLTLTQWLSMITHPQHWASENPTLFVAAFWSLNYEEQFYLVIAFCLLLVARKGVPILTSVIALTVFGLAFNIYHPGNWICGIFLEYWTHSLWVQCYFSSYANTQLGAHALCSSSLCLDLAYFS